MATLTLPADGDPNWGPVVRQAFADLNAAKPDQAGLVDPASTVGAALRQALADTFRTTGSIPPLAELLDPLTTAGANLRTALADTFARKGDVPTDALVIADLTDPASPEGQALRTALNDTFVTDAEGTTGSGLTMDQVVTALTTPGGPEAEQLQAHLDTVFSRDDELVGLATTEQVGARTRIVGEITVGMNVAINDIGWYTQAGETNPRWYRAIQTHTVGGAPANNAWWAELPLAGGVTQSAAQGWVPVYYDTIGQARPDALYVDWVDHLRLGPPTNRRARDRWSIPEDETV